MVIETDNGGDWNSDFPINLLYFGLLWIELNLDDLFIFSLAPYHSRFNPVELLWAKISRIFAGKMIG